VKPLGRGGLDAIVGLYLRDCQPRLAGQLRSFSDEPSLNKAVARACLAQSPDGKRYTHQRRIRLAALQDALVRLQSGNLSKSATFVHRSVVHIRGIGELYVYDTALRIGAKLGVFPEYVYLHSGTRVGARNLGLPWEGPHLLRRDLLPAFQGLRPHEVEDCLCIFKDRFRREAPAAPERRTPC
jgi:hypothetical protein